MLKYIFILYTFNFNSIANYNAFKTYSWFHNFHIIIEIPGFYPSFKNGKLFPYNSHLFEETCFLQCKRL